MSVTTIQTNRPFSLRDTYRDLGGRAMHGAIAEKDRMRGNIKINT
jgi:hypothetical protein